MLNETASTTVDLGILSDGWWLSTRIWCVERRKLMTCSPARSMVLPCAALLGTTLPLQIAARRQTSHKLAAPRCPQSGPRVFASSASCLLRERWWRTRHGRDRRAWQQDGNAEKMAALTMRAAQQFLSCYPSHEIGDGFDHGWFGRGRLQGRARRHQRNAFARGG